MPPKQFRFNDEKDIMLLREARCVNPFPAPPKGWTLVYTNLLEAGFFPPDGAASARTCRNRVELLIAGFEKIKNLQLASSGIEEEITEKDKLLEELIELRDEAARALKELKKESSGPSSSQEAGKLIRDQAMSGMVSVGVENSVDVEETAASTPKSKKRKTSTQTTEWTEYMKTRDESRMRIKQEEFDLRKMELEHAKKRDEEDRKERAELRRIQQEKDEKDREERTRMMELLIQAIARK